MPHLAESDLEGVDNGMAPTADPPSMIFIAFSYLLSVYPSFHLTSLKLISEVWIVWRGAHSLSPFLIAYPPSVMSRGATLCRGEGNEGAFNLPRCQPVPHPCVCVSGTAAQCHVRRNPVQRGRARLILYGGSTSATSVCADTHLT